jgi:hypothetical protein
MSKMKIVQYVYIPFLLLSVNLSAIKAQNLAAYRWEKRLLLVFAPNEKNADYLLQRTIETDNSAAFKERNLLVVTVKEEKLYQQYAVKPSAFVVILIGKDGSPKVRDTKPFTMSRLMDIIDSMPMRQDEIKRNKKRKF